MGRFMERFRDWDPAFKGDIVRIRTDREDLDGLGGRVDIVDRSTFSHRELPVRQRILSKDPPISSGDPAATKSIAMVISPCGEHSGNIPPMPRRAGWVAVEILHAPSLRPRSIINTEVSMTKTARRPLAFDSLEGKVLLSAGIADPAKTVLRAEVKTFLLTGTLKGIPYGSVQQDGIEVSSFSLTGTAKSMGKVEASLNLADPLIAPGKKPELSNATLDLSNSRGSVQLTMAASPSTRYIFVVTSGSGNYASALGSGTAVITYKPRYHEYQIALRSSAY
jgi:hypothetical protein